MNLQVGRVGKRHRLTFGIAAGMIALALYAAIVLASGTTADGVLGQLGFTNSSVNMMNAEGLNLPGLVTIDTSALPNRLYVADEENSRVLGWRDTASFTNGAPADLVIGQPGFTSSSLCNGVSARVSSNSLCYPWGVAVDGTGNLYVGDAGNSRVLEYTNPFKACNNGFPCAGGPANLVFGQLGNFNTNRCNIDTGGGNPTANDLCYPWGVAVDVAGNLYVADTANNRVLEYTAPLTPNTAADTVFGQGGIFTTRIPNIGGVSANGLYYPYAVALDVAGRAITKSCGSMTS
ncbi:hypothetical protein [Candidatus Binatus sp.]|uniref:hypothetical protein n=1 Tax=Candidatus Binatus sp. TaxID=2811406 RepID=UPI003BE6C40D